MPLTRTKTENSLELLVVKDFKNLVDLYLIFIEFDCPGDGTCSNQGTCDDTTGTCVCFAGFERSSGICQGNAFIF